MSVRINEVMMNVVRCLVCIAGLVVAFHASAESTTRSQVSRVKSDQRALATALEAYYIDNQQYPPVVEGERFEAYQLTTPVSFLTALPQDALKKYNDQKSLRLLDRASTAMGLMLYIPALGVLIAIIAIGFSRMKRSRKWKWLLCLILALPLLILIPRWITPWYWFDVPNFVAKHLYVPSEWEGDFKGFHYWSGELDGKDTWILQSVGTDADRDVPSLATLVAETDFNLKTSLLPYQYAPTNGTTSNGDIFRMKILD